MENKTTNQRQAMTIRETTYFDLPTYRKFYHADGFTGRAIKRARRELTAEGMAINFATHLDADTFARVTGQIVAGATITTKRGGRFFVETACGCDIVGRFCYGPENGGTRSPARYVSPSDLV